MTFDIDANGILKVTALDKATSRSQHITITASSGLSEAEIERMRREAEANADKDKKLKDLVEARNMADNTSYTTEKTIRDLGDKVPADLKTQAENAVKRLNEVKSGEDADAIRKAAEETNEILQKIGASAYSQGDPAGGPIPPEGGPTAGPTSGAGSKPGDDNVVDGEFRSA